MNGKRIAVCLSVTLLLNTVPNAVPAGAASMNWSGLGQAMNVVVGAIGATPAAAAAQRLAHELQERALEAARAARAATPPAARPAAGAALLLAPGALVGLVRFRRDPRRRVMALARRGTPVAAIARRTGLAQDAVRALMAPPEGSAASDRKSLPTGARRGPRPLRFETERRK
jgi:hypothetical protein